MATAIATIPVLTGEVAERFEAEAQATFEKYINRTPEEEASVRKQYEEGIAFVRQILKKSKLREE